MPAWMSLQKLWSHKGKVGAGQRDGCKLLFSSFFLCKAKEIESLKGRSAESHAGLMQEPSEKQIQGG